MSKKKIVIVSGPLAPYRMELYSSIGEEFRDVAQVEIIYGQKSQLDHNWKGLDKADENYSMVYSPCKYLPKWISWVLGKLNMGKGRPALPSFGMWKTLKKSQPDAIWLCEFNPYTLPALLYAKMHGIKVWVATDLGATNHPGDAKNFVKYICAFGSKYVDTIIACAPHATRPLWHTKKPIIFIPHAVTNSDYTPFQATHQEKEEPVILFVGNCIYRKGVDLMVRALGILKRKGVKFHLRMVGGSDADWLNKIADEEGVTQHISYSGFVVEDELKREYQNADLFVLPSRHDTYAVVSHEAAICGLPLILSKQAGSSEVLVNEDNGYVVNPEKIEDFAAKMEEFLVSAERRKSAGQASIELASKWGVKENAKRLKERLVL